MRGWTPDGREIDLTTEQAQAVTAIGRWARGEGALQLPAVGHGWGKSVVLATAARLDSEHRHRPRPPENTADFRRTLIQAMADPDVERAVHQAVARIQQRRNAANSGKVRTGAGKTA